MYLAENCFSADLVCNSSLQCWLPVQRFFPTSPKSDGNPHVQKVVDWLYILVSTPYNPTSKILNYSVKCILFNFFHWRSLWQNNENNRCSLMLTNSGRDVTNKKCIIVSFRFILVTFAVFCPHSLNFFNLKIGYRRQTKPHSCIKLQNSVGLNIFGNIWNNLSTQLDEI